METLQWTDKQADQMLYIMTHVIYLLTLQRLLATKTHSAKHV